MGNRLGAGPELRLDPLHRRRGYNPAHARDADHAGGVRWSGSAETAPIDQQIGISGRDMLSCESQLATSCK